MSLEVQFKLKSNPDYKRYLREHSQWYKVLNRNPEAFASFEEEVKAAYQLRPSDKIHKVLENIEMVQTILSTFHH